MGNSTGLAYDILEPVDYKSNNFWQLNQGGKKTEGKDGAGKQNVSIFRFPKATKPDRLGLAQKSLQKLKTIKHPYVLTYIETVEVEDSLVLVTESCVPLEQWLKSIINDPKVPKQYLFYELAWGFKCVLQALDFFHTNASLIHGNLSLQSIFVTPNGDWKLSGLELTCNVNNNDELNHFVSNHSILDNEYISPERLSLRGSDAGKIESVMKAKVPPYYIDIYSFGICVQKAFQICHEPINGSFEKHIALTIHEEIRKRPTAKKLLQTSTFNSDYIKILENVQEFSVKSAKDILESITQIEPLLSQITVPVCNYKLLPGVCKVLQSSITDFQNRDLREASRHSLVVCIDLLGKLASMKKLEEAMFQQECLTLVVSLWAMTDRTVRTALLTAIKHLSDLIPNAIVNKNMFDSIIAGFSDSNAKLRESTLMSLIYIVDKLDEVQLQDRLIRCITNLQNDPEASIRTNAIIFLGKIAIKLKEAVRLRVLCTALVKAMKDNFVHCRTAGLKTTNACLKWIDPPQIATKLIPQCSILLLDRSADVRTLSLSLLQSCIERMKEHHQHLTETEKDTVSKEDGQKGGNGATNISNNGNSNSTTGNSAATVTDSLLTSFASWSLQGLSLNGEKTDSDTQKIGELKKTPVVVTTSSSTSSLISNNNNNRSNDSLITSSSSTTNATKQQHITTSSSSKPTTTTSHKKYSIDSNDFDEQSNAPSLRAEYDLNHDIDDGEEMNFHHHQKTKKSSSSSNTTKQANWGDSGLDDALKFDDEEDDVHSFHDASDEAPTKLAHTFDSPRPHSTTVKSTPTTSQRTTVTSSPASAPGGMTITSNTKVTKAAKAPKVVGVKLEVSKDEGWEDF